MKLSVPNSNSNPNKSTQSIKIPSQYERDKETVRNYKSSQPYLAYDNYTSNVALAELRIRIRDTENALKYRWITILLDALLIVLTISVNVAVLLNVAIIHLPIMLVLVVIESLMIVFRIVLEDYNKYYDLKRDLELYNRQYRYWNRNSKFRL